MEQNICGLVPRAAQLLDDLIAVTSGALHVNRKLALFVANARLGWHGSKGLRRECANAVVAAFDNDASE